jgi:hypothetical protein
MKRQFCKWKDVGAVGQLADLVVAQDCANRDDIIVPVATVTPTARMPRYRVRIAVLLLLCV